ncbi:hypothetical protein BH09SUM1_BH09SUM1_33960 [soil metagenome]
MEDDQEAVPPPAPGEEAPSSPDENAEAPLAAAPPVPVLPSQSQWKDSALLANAAFPQLAQARQRSVRLIISIPVLTLLIVLGSAVFLYLYLMNSSQDTMVSADAVAELQKALPNHSPEVDYLIFQVQDSQNNLERVATRILLLSIFISIGAAIIGYILARQIVTPIHALTETMDAIAEGDFSTKLSPINLGEFGQLGMTFNRMVEQLNKLFTERDRQLRESFSGAHLLLERSGIVLQADSTARRIFGESASELTGKNLLDEEALIPAIQKNPRLLHIIRDLVAEAVIGHPSSRAITVSMGDQPSRYLLSCLQLEGDADGSSKLLLEVRDITGISSFYEQMQRADRLAAVGTLATGIAHEIRNPLASIRGMTQLLAESAAEANGGEPDPAADYHGRIIREVDRLEKLIAGIMDFAQSEDAPGEDVDLNQLLHEVVDSARHHAGDAAAGVTVEWELDHTLPHSTLQGERLRQALLNLVVNAFQHCSAAGSRGPIRVQTLYLSVNSQRPLIICIANPAEPLDEQKRERIFEPFYTTKPEGTGLGLPIAYQTIASNGGVLEVECENDEIQFWVRLPMHSTIPRSGSRIIPRPIISAV